MKNEASFILEWIAYHRAIGFTDFLVYTNDCEDGTVEMLERLEALGIVEHAVNKVLRRGPQKSALKAAKSHPKAAKADWILVSDIDEFLVVKVGDGTVRALIDHMPPDTDVIPVTWRLFSHDDRIEYVDLPVIEQFTDAERSLANGGFPDRFVKSLFRRQGDAERFGTHGPKGGDHVWRRPDGRLLGPDDNLTRPPGDFAYEVAQINHYAVGSVDSFLVKKDRGRVNHWRQDMGIDYWRRLCRGGEVDVSIHAWLDRTRAEMERLLADPTLRRLHEEGVGWRKKRVSELRADSRFEDMRRQILALSAERDHQRRSDAPPRPEKEASGEASPPKDAAARLEALCAEMRALMETITPHDGAELALDRLDDIEKGLFGKVRTG
jgi:hypothetical protein